MSQRRDSLLESPGMRMPLIRFNGDERPIAWWEWLCAPALVVVIFVEFVAVHIYWVMYPEMHAHSWDFGTPKEQRMMERYRARCARRVPFWSRVLRLVGMVVALPLIVPALLLYDFCRSLWDFGEVFVGLARRAVMAVRR